MKNKQQGFAVIGYIILIALIPIIAMPFFNSAKKAAMERTMEHMAGVSYNGLQQPIYNHDTNREPFGN